VTVAICRVVLARQAVRQALDLFGGRAERLDLDHYRPRAALSA
jgi:hypothetical protein